MTVSVHIVYPGTGTGQSTVAPSPQASAPGVGSENAKSSGPWCVRCVPESCGGVSECLCVFTSKREYVCPLPGHLSPAWSPALCPFCTPSPGRTGVREDGSHPCFLPLPRVCLPPGLPCHLTVPLAMIPSPSGWPHCFWSGRPFSTPASATPRLGWAFSVSSHGAAAPTSQHSSLLLPDPHTFLPGLFPPVWSVTLDKQVLIKPASPTYPAGSFPFQAKS